MDAKSLMIGDWVNITGHFLKVVEDGATTSLERTSIEMRPAKINCITTGAMYVDAHTNGEFEFSPIPLTEDILKNNGFRYEEFVGNHFMLIKQWRYEKFIVDVSDNIFIAFVKIDYVHELQHILRLCGLNDLVDNFKIKLI